MVGQQHRLGPLEMGIARQVGVACVDGPLNQLLLEGDHVGSDGGQLPLGEQAQVCGHLIVAAATGVELGPGGSGQLGDPALDGGVDVLVAGREIELTGGQFLLGLVERGQHLVNLGIGEQADAAQHPDVGPRPGNVVGCQPHVEADAGGVGHQLVGGVTVESAVPKRAHDGPARWARVRSRRAWSLMNPSASAC